MKHILITGADSYIGMSLEAHLRGSSYTISTLDVREDSWQDASFAGFDTGVITPETVPQPVSFYGKSKLAAEELIQKESDGNLRVCILRPPMVYGPGCKGNFQTVVKLVKKLPVFPQDREYMQTAQMARTIAGKLGKLCQTGDPYRNMQENRCEI